MDFASLIGLSKDELIEKLLPLGIEKFRIKQIWNWIYVGGVKSFDEMTNLSKDLREKLKLQLLYQGLKFPSTKNPLMEHKNG